jgi:hypothetical protein
MQGLAETLSVNLIHHSVQETPLQDAVKIKGIPYGSARAEKGVLPEIPRRGPIDCRNREDRSPGHEQSFR